MDAIDPHVSTRDVQLIGKRDDLIRSDRIGNDDQSIEWCKGDDVDRCRFGNTVVIRGTIFPGSV